MEDHAKKNNIDETEEEMLNLIKELSEETAKLIQQLEYLKDKGLSNQQLDENSQKLSDIISSLRTYSEEFNKFSEEKDDNQN